MVVSLIQVNDPTNIKQENDIIHLTADLRFTSTKNDVKKGKWYYEGTYEEGTGSFLVGFKSQYGLIQFWPTKSSSNHCVWLNDDFINSNTTCEVMNITIPSNEKYVFGIGIDIESRIFYIIQNNVAQTFHYPQQNIKSKYNMILRGAANNANENIRINFGKDPFIYSIGYSFNAWNQPEMFNTPPIIVKKDITVLYIFVLIHI